MGATATKTLPGDYLTTAEFATRLDINLSTAYIYIRRHRDVLKPFKLGRETRILESNFDILYARLVQNQAR